MLDLARQKLEAEEKEAKARVELDSLKADHVAAVAERNNLREQYESLKEMSENTEDSMNSRYLSMLREFEEMKAQCAQMERLITSTAARHSEELNIKDSIIAGLEKELHAKHAELSVQRSTVQDAVERADRAHDAVLKWQEIDRERRRDIERTQTQLLVEEGVAGQLREDLSVARSQVGSEAGDMSTRPTPLLATDGFIAESGQIGSPDDDQPLTARALRDAGLAPSPMQRSASIMSLGASSNWSTSSVGRLERLRSSVGSLVGQVASPPSNRMRRSSSMRKPSPATGLLRRADI